MRGTSGSRTGHRRAATILATAAALGIALALSTAPAAAAPNPSPAPSPSSGQSPTGGSSASPNSNESSSSKGRTAACTESRTGRVVNCPDVVPRTERPAGATKTRTLDAPVSNIAQLVDTRTWTTSGGNTFPGAEAPFGMTQWSPDTMPNRSAGGGYSFGDTSITGYSLTHISGPGCGAAEDVPMLPITGSLSGSNPNGITTAFSNTNEIAQAGYYSAQSNQPNTITSEFTATPHASMGRFTYPATTQAGFLIKLHDSQNGEFAPSTATVIGSNEVSGSETSGHFCGEANNDGQQQEYTVHFDIVFDQPFTSSQVIKRTSDGTPTAVYLTFDTTSNPVVQAKVATSYVSTANARLDWQQEIPNWDFDDVKAADQQAWNDLLGRIQVSGGAFDRTQMFYSLLYKDFIQPNISSDVNGQFMGADGSPHTVVAGQQDQYGTYSGWDTYHSLAQLQAMLDPSAASDQAQSELNYYDEDQLLQQWGYLHLNNYVMVGDPMQSIIADYYAFGAHDFDTATALKDMLAQATTVNDVRPGEALEEKYGYLPEDGTYGCCNPHGYVPTMLEYNSEDLALSFFARALGDDRNADMLEARANNWQNVFNLSNNLLNGRNQDGSFVPGVTPSSTTRFVEGTAYEYMWNVPNNYPALFSLLGGKSKVVPAINEYLSQPDGFGTHALLTNEFDFGEQYMLNYAQDPADTQRLVNMIRNTMYQPGPSLDNNDDLGANSSTFIWEMLGMYPENSGSDNLVFNSPGFPHTEIDLPNGKTITSNAPGASPDVYYVQNLKLNGSPYHKLYVPFSTLAKGATLNWTLGASPSTWGTAPQDAPPSYDLGEQPVLASIDPSAQVLQPGAQATSTLLLADDSDSQQTVSWTASADNGLTVSPTHGSLTIAAGRRASRQVTIATGANTPDGRYSITFKITTASGEQRTVALSVAVAQRGELWPYYTNAGITDDNNTSAATYDGGGWSYSAQALAAQGVTPGSTVTVNGIDYTWPDVPVATLDNIEAAGQTIPLAAPDHASVIGLLGSATNSGSGGAGGTATIHYTDGSTSQFTARFSDWTLGAGGFPPLPYNNTPISMPYRNFSGNQRDNVTTHVFEMEAPVSVAKTVDSITLPQATGGDMHILAIALPPAAPHAATLSPDMQKGGARVGTAATFTETLTNAGYQADSYDVAASSSWPAHVYQSDCTTAVTTTATVQPGDSVDLCVKVDVPAAAANGDSSDTTITATSTGDSSVTASAKLTSIAVSVDTLLVDGDGGGPNVESYYKDALTANNTAYSYWDLTADPALPASMLTAHKTVVWLTGNSYPGPITAYEPQLKTFLDGGGRLFLSGQDILDQSAGSTAFVHDYLHVNWDGTDAQNDKPTVNVHGVAGSPVSDGVGAIALDHNVLGDSYEDQVTLITPATPAFTDDGGAADALTVAAGAYKVVFLAFPFEAYGGASDKADLMHRVLTYLS